VGLYIVCLQTRNWGKQISNSQIYTTFVWHSSAFQDGVVSPNHVTLLAAIAYIRSAQLRRLLQACVLLATGRIRWRHSLHAWRNSFRCSRRAVFPNPWEPSHRQVLTVLALWEHYLLPLVYGCLAASGRTPPFGTFVGTENARMIPECIQGVERSRNPAPVSYVEGRLNLHVERATETLWQLENLN